jgi:hypothetical protein
MTKDDIIRTVCDVCEVEPHDLTNRTRKKNVTMARQIIAYHLYHSLCMPIQQIAQAIGTSTAYVYKPLFRKPVNRRARNDAEFWECWNEIELRLARLNSARSGTT